MAKQAKQKARKTAGSRTKPAKARSSAALHRGISGGLDFIGAAFFALVIITLMFMLNALITWVRRDVNVVFSDLGTSITDALIIRRDASDGIGR